MPLSPDPHFPHLRVGPVRSPLCPACSLTPLPPHLRPQSPWACPPGLGNYSCLLHKQ